MNKLPDYTNSEISVRIDEYIHSERDRAILKRRLIDGLKYEALAEEFYLSDRQVKKIVKDGYIRLFHLYDPNITKIALLVH